MVWVMEGYLVVVVSLSVACFAAVLTWLYRDWSDSYRDKRGLGAFSEGDSQSMYLIDELVHVIRAEDLREKSLRRVEEAEKATNTGVKTQ
jgi:hypothetical protein